MMHFVFATNLNELKFHQIQNFKQLNLIHSNILQLNASLFHFMSQKYMEKYIICRKFQIVEIDKKSNYQFI